MISTSEFGLTKLGSTPGGGGSAGVVYGSIVAISHRGSDGVDFCVERMLHSKRVCRDNEKMEEHPAGVEEAQICTVCELRRRKEREVPSDLSPSAGKKCSGRHGRWKRQRVGNRHSNPPRRGRSNEFDATSGPIKKLMQALV